MRLATDLELTGIPPLVMAAVLPGGAAGEGDPAPPRTWLRMTNGSGGGVAMSFRAWMIVLAVVGVFCITLGAAGASVFWQNQNADILKAEVEILQSEVDVFGDLLRAEYPERFDAKPAPAPAATAAPSPDDPLNGIMSKVGGERYQLALEQVPNLVLRSSGPNSIPIDRLRSEFEAGGWPTWLTDEALAVTACESSHDPGAAGDGGASRTVWQFYNKPAAAYAPSLADQARYAFEQIYSPARAAGGSGWFAWANCANYLGLLTVEEYRQAEQWVDDPNTQWNERLAWYPGIVGLEAG